MYRIVAIFISSSSHYSRWSRVVSFAHIYPVHPVFRLKSPVNVTHFRISWAYNSMARFPINEYVIIHRRARQQDHKTVYSPFTRIHITDINTTVTSLFFCRSSNSN